MQAMVTASPVLIGVLAFLLTLAVRSASTNRGVRSRLRLSLALFAGYAALSFVLGQGWLRDEMAAGVLSVTHLVLALATINALVVLAVNPFRADRVPEHFPPIVQDTIIIGLFLVVGTLLMQEKFLTTSAVGAVVIGFALQDTLGNMFAGLAIQVEKPFRVGQWITVASHEGQVAEITWRATKLRTKAGNLVIVPNNIISKEAIVNFSQPDVATRLQIDVGVSYQVPPNAVKRALAEAVAPLPLVARTPAPEVLLVDFSNSSITYRVRFWTADFAIDELARDQVRTAVYYMLKRSGMEIPFPIRTTILRRDRRGPTDEEMEALAAAIERADLFAALPADVRADLLAASAERLYGAGEPIVRQGDAGESMFVICRGRVRVTVGSSGQEVATIEEGGYFGEMSLLTGDRRTATVTALTDCLLLEITAGAFRRFALAHPAVVEQVSVAVATRREGLERARLAAAAPAGLPAAAPRSFLARVQAFLGLPAH